MNIKKITAVGIMVVAALAAIATTELMAVVANQRKGLVGRCI